MMGSTSIETAHAYLSWVSTINVGPDLSRVDCPALVLTTTTPRRAYSRSDLEVYRGSCRKRESLRSRSTAITSPRAAPDESAPIMLDFLRRYAEGKVNIRRTR